MGFIRCIVMTAESRFGADYLMKSFERIESPRRRHVSCLLTSDKFTGHKRIKKRG
jgi:hypothetical protein